jgi:outer membrane protein assembly factor BamB
MLIILAVVFVLLATTRCRGWRLSAALVVALCSVVHVATRPVVAAGQGQQTWQAKIGGEVLAVVNADSARVTIRDPGDESVSVANASLLMSPAGQGGFQILGTPAGVALLAVRDNTPFVQLVGWDVPAGTELWRVACTDLLVADLSGQPNTRANRILSGFMVDRRQVIVVQRPEAKPPNGGGARALIAYDLRTGSERWRTTAPGIDIAEMMRQMNQQLKGLAGRIAQKSMEDAMSAGASYFTLPDRNLLMKVAVNPTGGLLEAVDLDTGASTWSLTVPLPHLDRQRSMASPARADMMKNMARDPAQFSARSISRLFRGDLFFPEACSAVVAEASVGTGQCASLRAYSMNTGKMVWEFAEPSQDLVGWVGGHETVLVRLPKKVVGLRLSTGEKLYEIADHRVAGMVPAFGRTTYADGSRILWIDQRNKMNTLVALDASTGTMAWEAPISKDDVIGFMVRDAMFAVVTTTEVVLFDRASGQAISRERPFGGAPIRSAHPLDAGGVVVVGDQRISRYDTNPWNQVYATTIPSPEESIGSKVLQLLATAALEAMWLMPVSGPGGQTMPYGLTPAGAAITYRLNFPDLPPALVAKLERRSSHYCYFASGNAIHRVDVLTGKREEVVAAPKKDTTFVVDESHGVGFEIRKGALTGHAMPMDDDARRAAVYSEGMEEAAALIRRAEKLEAADKANAAASYAGAMQLLANALAAGADETEKAVVNLARGHAAERLAVVRPEESASWRERATAEYTAAAKLTCGRPGASAENLCRTVTQLLGGKAPE